MAVSRVYECRNQNFHLLLSHLTRTQLELELKQEKEKKSQNRAAPGKVTQKPEPRMVTNVCAFSARFIPPALMSRVLSCCGVHVQTAKQAARRGGEGDPELTAKMILLSLEK